MRVFHPWEDFRRFERGSLGVWHYPGYNCWTRSRPLTGWRCPWPHISPWVRKKRSSRRWWWGPVSMATLPCISSGSWPYPFVGSYYPSWVERGTVKIGCLSQEHSNIIRQGGSFLQRLGNLTGPKSGCLFEIQISGKETEWTGVWAKTRIITSRSWI